MKCKTFFSVQYWVDGFGHDTAIWRCFETRQSAENAIKKAVEKGRFKENELVIVKQKFNTDWEHYFD